MSLQRSTTSSGHGARPACGGQTLELRVFGRDQLVAVKCQSSERRGLRALLDQTAERRGLCAPANQSVYLTVITPLYTVSGG